MEDLEEKIRELSFTNRELYSVVVELTDQCNWRCKHCYINEHTNPGMDYENVVKMLDELKEAGAFELTFTGGEIFLRNDIFDIIAYARRIGFKVILFTNVSLLNEEKIKKLKNMFVSQISCTVFSMNEKTHDYITGINGSLKRALKNIDYILNEKIPLEIKTIITNINYNEWSSVEAFCKENGIGFKIDHDVFARKDGTYPENDIRITSSQFDMTLHELDRARAYEVREHDKDEFVCSGIQNALFIDCKGNVFPCNKFLYHLGNISDENITEIWNNSSELKRLQNMKWRDLKKCNGCKDSKYCIHCPGTAYLEDGDEYGPSTMSCEKARLRAKRYIME